MEPLPWFGIDARAQGWYKRPGFFQILRRAAGVATCPEGGVLPFDGDEGKVEKKRENNDPVRICQLMPLPRCLPGCDTLSDILVKQAEQHPAKPR